jgi:hypothetical protein
LLLTYGVYFIAGRSIRQGENWDTEILDKEHFTELKYNKDTMQ